MTKLTLTANPRVASYPLDDEIVLYAPKDGQAYILNRTAARIWTLCDGTRDETAVAREIASVYDRGYDDVLADVRDLIEHLRAVGLIAPEAAGC
ncbi:MAG: PqqD family protein [Chloroflexi bacterium]|nr:PqqD family protein [Chloroflexota bacterium]